MFLKKITKLKSLGRFRVGAIQGGEYAKYTLFYGGNGKGKTTLCAALRSFQLDNPSYLRERRSFGATSGPEVGFLLDTGVASFTGDKWTAASPDMHIFDEHFVAENIHNGQDIDTTQRRNVYRVVVGAVGVGLAEQIDAIDAQVTAITTDIATAKKVLQQHLPSGLTLDQFLALTVAPDVEAKLAEATTLLGAARNTAAIAAGPLLTTVVLPGLPADFANLCMRTLNDVVAGAQALIREHLARHAFGEKGEGWMAEGVRGRKGADCPFCGEALAGNELVATMDAYFGQSYADHKTAIKEMKAALGFGLSEAVGLRVERGFKELQEGVEFWTAFASLVYQPPHILNELQSALTALRVSAMAMIERKLASPLDSIETSADLLASIAKWEDVLAGLTGANGQVAVLNQLIGETKKATSTSDESTIVREISRLEAAKKRHEEPVQSLATAFADLQRRKTDLVATKRKLPRQADHA